MKLLNSVCTNLVFPESRRDADAFRKAAGFLSERDVGGVEFFHDGPHPDLAAKAAADFGLDPFFIAVIPSKERRLDLCGLDRDNRRKALEMCEGFLDYCRDNGIEKFMINSGRRQDDAPKALEALADSIERLHNYADRRNQKLRLYLEPCDSAMQVFHLVGPTARATALCRTLAERGLDLFLTMDTAHASEEGEDFAAAVEEAKPHCDHVHFANCRISDPSDPLYGDQHVGFEYPDTPWSPKALEKLFRRLEEIYPGDEPLRVAIEVLCREDDPYAYFERMRESLPFLGGKRREKE